MTKTKNIYVYGTGGLVGFLVFLMTLSNYGVHVSHTGDMVCKEVCESYFNITLENYALCLKDLKIKTNPEVPTEIYKKQNNEWIYLNMSDSCLEKNKIHEFKIIGLKMRQQNIKWEIEK